MNDLNDLPPPIEDPRTAQQNYAAARAAYMRSFTPNAWHAPLGRTQAVLMPVVLAAFVGLYMMWAVASATAMVR